MGWLSMFEWEDFVQGVGRGVGVCRLGRWQRALVDLACQGLCRRVGCVWEPWKHREMADQGRESRLGRRVEWGGMGRGLGRRSVLQGSECS